MSTGAQLRGISPNQLEFQNKIKMRHTVVSINQYNEKKQSIIENNSKMRSNYGQMKMKNPLFNQGTIKFEGELSSISQNQNVTKNFNYPNNSSSQIKKESSKNNNNDNDVLKKLNNNNSFVLENNEKSSRSLTPGSNNKNVLNTYKSLPKSNFPVAQSLFTKKEPKLMEKKAKSYYVPKSGREKLNKSNMGNSHRSLNNSKLDTSNSFLANDLNRTGGFKRSKSKNDKNTSFIINKKHHNRSFNIASNSNSNLSRTFDKKQTNNRSISPNNTSRLTNKSPSFNKIKTNEISKLQNQNNNPFDVTAMKNFKDIKHNNAINNVYSIGYASKLQNNKVIKNGNKFGSMNNNNNKKVITGNLMNMNTNDVSTTSTIRSKIDNPNSTTNRESSKPPINEKKSYVHQIPIKYGEKEDNSTTTISRINNMKKSDVDFRQITTSPLLRVNNSY